MRAAKATQFRLADFGPDFEAIEQNQRRMEAQANRVTRALTEDIAITPTGPGRFLAANGSNAYRVDLGEGADT